MPSPAFRRALPTLLRRDFRITGIGGSWRKPLASACLPNQPFDITKYIPANQKTIDLVHRFYQEQVQIDGGKMDKFVAVSDAKALAMGYYPTEKLPVAKEPEKYVLQDNFFHASFGGSYLNHQWLICACTPVYANAVHDGGPSDLHTVLGANGLPISGKDKQLTTQATGDYAINTIFPRTHRPSGPRSRRSTTPTSATG